MLNGREGNGNPRHSAEARPPDSRADQHLIRGNTTPIGVNPPDPAVGDLDARDRGTAVKRRAGFRGAGHGFAGAYGFGNAIRWHIVRAMDSIRIQEGESGSGLVGRNDVGFQVP